jgi:hypothetical protein
VRLFPQIKHEFRMNGTRCQVGVDHHTQETRRAYADASALHGTGCFSGQAVLRLALPGADGGKVAKKFHRQQLLLLLLLLLLCCFSDALQRSAHPHRWTLSSEFRKTCTTTT